MIVADFGVYSLQVTRSQEGQTIISSIKLEIKPLFISCVESASVCTVWVYSRADGHVYRINIDSNNDHSDMTQVHLQHHQTDSVVD